MITKWFGIPRHIEVAEGHPDSDTKRAVDVVVEGFHERIMTGDRHFLEMHCVCAMRGALQIVSITVF